MKNKLLMILLSVIVAFAMWLYVVMVVSPESEDTFEGIPVVMDGTAALESRNLMIVSDTNLRVNLKLVGNRQDLNKLNSSNITILADLSQITEPGEHNVKYTISYPGTVQSGTIEAQEKVPQYVTVVVAERSQKTIDVDVEYLGSVPENFIAEKAVLDHATVTISGPKDVIDRVDHARITIDLKDRTMNISNVYRYALSDAAGNSIEDTSHITASASDIRVTVKIDQLKKVKLVFDVLEGGGIQESDVTITPVDAEQTWITVRGSQVVLAKLDEIYIGQIDLSKMTGSGRIAFNVKMPDGVENFSEIYTVFYDVTIPDLPILETREFQVSNTNFVLENFPDDVKVIFNSQTCRVSLRGPAEILKKLTQENIRVIVDYAQQDTIIMNAHNVLQVRFEIVDMDGNVITEVGEVPPEGEDNNYQYTINVKVETQEENTGE